MVCLQNLVGADLARFLRLVVMQSTETNQMNRARTISEDGIAPRGAKAFGHRPMLSVGVERRISGGLDRHIKCIGLLHES